MSDHLTSAPEAGSLPAAAPVIEARKLDLVFQTGDTPVHALKDIDLDIFKG